MQEKKGSEKREVLLISFSISARFVFAIITRTRCCVFTRTLYNAMFFAYLITIFFAPKKSGIPNSLSERLITYIYILFAKGMGMFRSRSLL